MRHALTNCIPSLRHSIPSRIGQNPTPVTQRLRIRRLLSCSHCCVREEHLAPAPLLIVSCWIFCGKTLQEYLPPPINPAMSFEPLFRSELDHLVHFKGLAIDIYRNETVAPQSCQVIFKLKILIEIRIRTRGSMLAPRVVPKDKFGNALSIEEAHQR